MPVAQHRPPNGGEPVANRVGWLTRLQDIQAKFEWWSWPRTGLALSILLSYVLILDNDYLPSEASYDPKGLAALLAARDQPGRSYGLVILALGSDSRLRHVPLESSFPTVEPSSFGLSLVWPSHINRAIGRTATRSWYWPPWPTPRASRSFPRRLSRVLRGVVGVADPFDLFPQRLLLQDARGDGLGALGQHAVPVDSAVPGARAAISIVCADDRRPRRSSTREPRWRTSSRSLRSAFPFLFLRRRWGRYAAAGLSRSRDVRALGGHVDRGLPVVSAGTSGTGHGRHAPPTSEARQRVANQNGGGRLVHRSPSARCIPGL